MRIFCLLLPDVIGYVPTKAYKSIILLKNQFIVLIVTPLLSFLLFFVYAVKKIAFDRLLVKQTVKSF